jgi:ferredoxin/flavodoxin---NADP+ reductase
MEAGRSVIAERRLWTDGLLTLRLSCELEKFRPGQFINVGLEVEGSLVRRSYSLASAPGAAPEIFLNEVPGGALTPSLFALPVGASVAIDPRPRGFFTLDYVPAARELWMLATGTGLGPFISMLRSGEPQRRFDRVVLVHGVKRRAELAYADELDALSAQSAGAFTRVASVTRESSPASKGELRGRIPVALAEGRLEAAAGIEISLEHSHVMLCGNPGMIADATNALSVRGLRKHRERKPGHITTEKYW